VFIVVPIIFGITAWIWYPETKNYSLEQIAVIFDGDAATLQPGEVYDMTRGEGKGDVVHREHV
jgi:hypothetical protein